MPGVLKALEGILFMLRFSLRFSMSHNTTGKQQRGKGKATSTPSELRTPSPSRQEEGFGYLDADTFSCATLDIRPLLVLQRCSVSGTQGINPKDGGTCTISGMKVQRIINEPITAEPELIAYTASFVDERPSCVQFGRQYVRCYPPNDWRSGVTQVLATNGDTHLGGEDFDISA